MIYDGSRFSAVVGIATAAIFGSRTGPYQPRVTGGLVNGRRCKREKPAVLGLEAELHQLREDNALLRHADGTTEFSDGHTGPCDGRVP